MVGAFGLFLDLIGVMLLSIDLIRVQRRMRESADESANVFRSLFESFGGIQSWASEVEKKSRFISGVALGETFHTASDAISWNLDRSIESVKELANCTAGNAEWLTRLTEAAKQNADIAEKDARMSLYYSYIGMPLIIIGFLFQIVAVSYP